MTLASHDNVVRKSPNHSSTASTPSPESIDGDSQATMTPYSQTSTSDESDGGHTVATSTLTTTITTLGKPDAVDPISTQFKHVGANAIHHHIGKDGQITLKPVAASSSRVGTKRFRAIVPFRPRHSHFDRFNQNTSNDQFRGFFTLFWICLALFVLNTFYTSFANTGQVLSMTFATLFSKDAGMLALSDGVLIASLFLCVPFIKLVKSGWISYWHTGAIIQHLWQTALLGFVIKWARYREWPWVQSGFFVLHTLCMMMKIHSYLSVNGNMADTYHRMRRMESMLEERVAEVEGSEAGSGQEQLAAAWLKAVKVANTHSALPDQKHQRTSESEERYNVSVQRGTSSLRLRKSVEDSSSSVLVPQAASHGTMSEKQANESQLPTTKKHQRQRTTSDAKSEVMTARDPHPLVDHPDQVISDLAKEIEFMREYLLSAASPTSSDLNIIWPQTTMWPENVTYANFWDYLLVPTLVYELSYPRTRTIRPLYLLEKTLATFGTFFVIYVLTSHWIMPFTPNRGTPLLRSFLELAVPMMIVYLLIFYIIFECVCNGFAELTRFADREFYEDWWNATSMAVFSRKWNKPVHTFLLKHVYASTISAWGLSKNTAMFLTFLLSSLVHELVMAIVSGKIRFYLFSAQMFQLPLIVISQIPFIKRNESLGNLMFWVGLMAGFPLLNIGYLIY